MSQAEEAQGSAAAKKGAIVVRRRGFISVSALMVVGSTNADRQNLMMTGTLDCNQNCIIVVTLHS